MRFLVDRCAGCKLARWLISHGHDVIESSAMGPDPGDLQVLEWAFSQERILITIDTDFGKLVYAGGVNHCGMVRLPDVPAEKRIQLMELVLNRYQEALETGAIITVRGERIRVSRPKFN